MVRCSSTWRLLPSMPGSASTRPTSIPCPRPERRMGEASARRRRRPHRATGRPQPRRHSQRSFFSLDSFPTMQFTYVIPFKVSTDMARLVGASTVPGMYFAGLADNWEVYLNGVLVKGRDAPGQERLPSPTTGISATCISRWTAAYSARATTSSPRGSSPTPSTRHRDSIRPGPI